MGSLQSWRKAYGALKDTTTVSLAKINSDYKDLDVAIVKATNHVEYPPKERHVRKIFVATSVLRPRADIAYCINALGRRLQKTHNWTVALKTLLVLHRTLREGDPIFREELLNFSHKGQILQISNFKDDSSPLAWDCSAWVRTYALFLEERLECFRILKYDIEAECLVKTSKGVKGHSRTRDLKCGDLLEQLPALQQLLSRLVSCKPEGAAFDNYLIQYALLLVLKESFKIYCAINDGVINLVDMFFEMSRYDATKALDIYKIAGQQAGNLSEFYEFCKGLDLARNFHFPSLRQPPSSFLGTMEEYIREAPKIGSVSNKKLEYRETKLLTYKEEGESPSTAESPKKPIEQEVPAAEAEEPQPLPNEVVKDPLPPTTGDLLCIDDINPAAAAIEEGNAYALAIFPSGENPTSSAGGGDFFKDGTTGWELALVTAPSNNEKHLTESKLAGGFDKLLLESLYEDANARSQQNVGGYGSSTPANPFGIQDPFAMSNTIAPPPNVQMALMAQQQHYLQQQYLQQQQQGMMTTCYQPHYTQSHGGVAAANPFGDPFVGLSHGVPPRGNPNLI